MVTRRGLEPHLTRAQLAALVLHQLFSSDKMADDKSLSDDLKGLKKKKKKGPKNPDDTEDQLKELASKLQSVQLPTAETTEGTADLISDVSLENDLKGMKKKKGKKKIERSDINLGVEEIKSSDGPSFPEYTNSDLSNEKKSTKEVRIKAPEDDLSESTTFSELFSLPPKKKKRRPNITFEGFDIEDVVTTEGLAEGQADGIDDELEDLKQKMPWLTSDRDYSYEELLERAFRLITRNNPSMAGGKQKFIVRPPQVIRAGRKTSFANFADICKTLHREPKHLMAFLMAELGTSGSVDGNNQLIIKGVFQQKNVESVLKKYIKEYVTCHTCRSPDTILQREIRLTFLQCETCGSKCSVQNIRTGFQAVTNRAQMRLRQT